MKTAAVIAEFNPFHSGHEYLINQLRSAGATHVVAVMSGNFVQRGEPAFYDKFLRARAAVACGVDLAVELPLPWASAGAQVFARGGVGIVQALGCVDFLGFGSECGDIEALKNVAQAVASPAFSDRIKTEVQRGVTFASARQAACEKLLGSGAMVLSQPNNALAVEYISALKQLNCGVEPLTVKRVGDGHDCTAGAGGFLSGAALREKIKSGGNLKGIVPDSSLELYSADCADYSRLNTAVLCKLRQLGAAEIALAPDVSEGLENRIFSAVREAATLEELFTLLKTKRYTLARLRRIVLSLFLGVTAEDSKGTPPYIRVLAKNARGAEILNAAKPTLPVVGRASQLLDMGGSAGELFALECRADDVFALAFSPARPCGADLKNRI